MRVRAAGLWVGERGVISGSAAAWWHRMHPTAPSVVELTVPRARAPRPQSGVRLRRRDLSHLDLVRINGLWLTDKALTALETAVAVPEGSTFLDRALQRHVSFSRVYRAYCRNLGARGSARAGDLLVAVEIVGWAWHMDVDRFRADRHKGNALVRARWDLLRFTWHDLTNRPDYVVEEIQAALHAAGRRPRSSDG